MLTSHTTVCKYFSCIIYCEIYCHCAPCWWICERVLGRSQVTRKGEIGLNQSLICMHPFSPLHPNFLSVRVQLSIQKKLFLSRKIIGGAFAHLTYPPPPSHAYGHHHHPQRSHAIQQQHVINCPGMYYFYVPFVGVAKAKWDFGESNSLKCLKIQLLAHRRHNESPL